MASDRFERIVIAMGEAEAAAQEEQAEVDDEGDDDQGDKEEKPVRVEEPTDI